MEPVYLSMRTVKELVHWSVWDCNRTGISVNEDCEGAGSLVSEGLRRNRYICQRGLWRSWFIGLWGTTTEPVYLSMRTVKELVHWSVRDCNGTGISVNEDCEGAGSLVNGGLRRNQSIGQRGLWRSWFIGQWATETEPVYICQRGLWRSWFIGRWGTATEPVYLSTRTVKELVHWSVRDCDGTGISVYEDCEGAGSLVGEGLRQNRYICQRGLWRSWFIGRWGTATEPVYLSTRTVKELVHWSVRDCDGTGILVNEDVDELVHWSVRDYGRTGLLSVRNCEGTSLFVNEGLWWNRFTCQRGTLEGTGLLVRKDCGGIGWLVKDCEGSGLFDYEELWLTRAHRVIVLRSAVLVLLFLCAFMFHLPVFFRVASIVWLHQCQQWSNHEEYG